MAQSDFIVGLNKKATKNGAHLIVFSQGDFVSWIIFVTSWKKTNASRDEYFYQLETIQKNQLAQVDFFPKQNIWATKKKLILSILLVA